MYIYILRYYIWLIKKKHMYMWGIYTLDNGQMIMVDNQFVAS